jgi:hypothetical protein
MILGQTAHRSGFQNPRPSDHIISAGSVPELSGGELSANPFHPFDPWFLQGEFKRPEINIAERETTENGGINPAARSFETASSCQTEIGTTGQDGSNG